MIWTSENVGHIILHMAASLLKQTPGTLAGPRPGLDLYRDLGLDSIRRLELAAQVNEFFGVLETSAENYLLTDTRLEHWTACVLRARHQTDQWLTLRTSGTGGARRPVRLRLETLLGEARYLAGLLPRPQHVVSAVAAQHIYGFLYTVLLPHYWQCPLRQLSQMSAAELTPQTLIIATPLGWQYIQASLLGSRPLTGWGVSSGSPLPPGLYAALDSTGSKLWDVYGSTETGGLGFRRRAEDPYTPFAYLQPQPATGSFFRTDTRQLLTGPDRLAWEPDGRFRVLGRLDGSVAIAGVNVYPGHIQEVIARCPLVAECDVYAKAQAGDPQLYAAVRLRTLSDATRQACQNWLQEHLTAAEMPRHLYMY